MIAATGIILTIAGLLATWWADRQRNWRALNWAWGTTLFGAICIAVSLAIHASKVLP